MTSRSDIEVIALRHLTDGRPLRAFVDVRIGEWTVHDWRVIKQNGQRAYVSPPQVSWKDNQGAVHYRALLSLPADQRQLVELAILSAWMKEQHNDNSK